MCFIGYEMYEVFWRSGAAWGKPLGPVVPRPARTIEQFRIACFVLANWWFIKLFIFNGQVGK